MKRLTIAVVAAGAALLGVNSLAGAAGTGSTKTTTPTGSTKKTTPAAVSVVSVIGAPVNIKVGQFAKAYAFCPRGYYVVGGGAYNGAITEIASGPTGNLRGWFVDGSNPGGLLNPKGTTFKHWADAVCVKGNASLTIGPPPTTKVLRHAEAEFVSINSARRSR